MDLISVIAELRSQRDSVNEAIFSLERLAFSRSKRRGRPHKGAAHGVLENGLRHLGMRGGPRTAARNNSRSA